MSKKIVASLLTILGLSASVVAPVSAEDINIGTIKSNYGIQMDFGTLFANIFQFVLVVAALITFGYMVWGAIDWITSSGDKAKLEAALGKIRNAIIGLLIVAAMWAIYLLVLKVTLGINSNNGRLDLPLPGSSKTPTQTKPVPGTPT